jgi:hypothetical protein
MSAILNPHSQPPTFSIDFPIDLFAAVRVTVYPGAIVLGLLKGLHKEEFAVAQCLYGRVNNDLPPQQAFETCRTNIEKMFADFMHRIDTIDFEKVLAIGTDLNRSDPSQHPTDVQR